MSDEMRFKLSESGQRMAAGADGSLDATLMLEVMKRVDDEGITEGNLYAVLDELVARCGSIENAIVALKTGERRIEKDYE